ncbi:hypothetical protein PWT90_07476 [Aphanocladium album]|nr:hypothetical protein PWT90_07476 [Aphanocladium album]
MMYSIHTLAFLASVSHAAAATAGSDGPDFDWDTITPSTDLEYHPCYGEYQCARLILPLDWQNASRNPATVIIAVSKLPAAVPDSDPSFGGTVFTQPGGPGVSGTDYLRGNGRKLGDAITIPGRRHYELLAFDPRGLGRSLPQLDCFPGLLGYLRAQERDMADAVDAGRAALARAVAAGEADGKRCADEHGDFLRHVGTADVARDMVALLDKIEEERRRRREEQEAANEEQVQLELRSAGGKDSEGKKVPRLQYIGISYGTFLGSVFASMFPGRVGRLVLDGVVNLFGYQDQNKQGTVIGINDIDEMADLFFQGCFEASACPIRQPTDKSGADISRRFWSWASSLQDAPLVIHTADGNRRYVSTDPVRQMLISSLYHPSRDFTSLAATFDAGMRSRDGDDDAMALFSDRVLGAAGFTPIPAALRANFSSYTSMTKLFDAYVGIACADGVDVTGRSLDGWQALLDRYTAISRIGGPWMARLQMLCSGWTMRAKKSFHGPFETPEPSEAGRAEEEGRPAAPILFLSNRLDPVTPLRDARITRGLFPGAGLVVQETMGHCVTLCAPGPCVKNIMAEYFRTAAVPEEEVTCEVKGRIWDV